MAYCTNNCLSAYFSYQVSLMEGLLRLKASRREHRSYLWQNYRDYSIPMGINGTTVNRESESLTTALDKLQEKKTVLASLDSQITAALTDETELETEICDSQDYETTLIEKIAYLREFLEQNPRSLPSRPPPVTNHPHSHP